MRAFRWGILGAALLVSAVSAFAETVVVEGVAQILGGNLTVAREEAIRNALAEASRRSTLSVGATLSTRAAQVVTDQTVVRSAALVHRHQIVAESHDAAFYRVTISADLESAAGRSANAVCRDGHVKRLLIGGFPVLRPEQLRRDELQGYAHLTAGELARRFSAQPAVFVDANGRLMVHPGVPERVLGDVVADAQALPRVRAAAEKHRAQYVLVGQFLSLAVGADGASREIDLDALILDPMTGSCIARKRFSKVASGTVVLPRSVGFGSPTHYATDFGRSYGEVLSEVAAWAEATTSCQPFAARVIKVDKTSVYLDAGAEQGLSIGDVFNAFKNNAENVVTPGGEILGQEKTVAGELRLTSVYPRFSIGEYSPALPYASSFDAAPRLEIGDTLYSR